MRRQTSEMISLERMLSLVMPGLVPGIHVLSRLVDGRDKPGHDDPLSTDVHLGGNRFFASSTIDKSTYFDTSIEAGSIFMLTAMSMSCWIGGITGIRSGERETSSVVNT